MTRHKAAGIACELATLGVTATGACSLSDPGALPTAEAGRP